MTATQIAWALGKIVLMLAFLLNVGGLLTWVDRRLGSMIQDRIGPNRAALVIGKFQLRVAGLLHTAADGVKFFFKEDFMPPKADKLLFGLAPILSLFPVLALTAVIPFGDTVSPGMLWRKICVTPDGSRLFFDVALGQCVDAAKNVVAGAETKTIFPIVSRLALPAAGGEPVDLQIASLNVGILYVFAMAGQGIVGAAIAGWSSDNKFSLMGALRAASQMVSYEVTMGLSLVGAFMLYGSLRLEDMVRWQGENTWGIFVQPLAFFLFFAAATAEQKRIPFDLPEAESELVSGYFTEYSGMKFGMFYLAEYLEVVTSSMLLVTIFLGGWNLPFFHRDGITIAIGDSMFLEQKMSHLAMTLIGVLAFFGKVIVVCLVQAFVRWSLPRFRYDQLMKLGWTFLLPLSLANVFVTGVTWLALDSAGEAVAGALKIAADLSQAFVAVLLSGLTLWGISGLFRERAPKQQLIGSSAQLAADAGGTQTAPIEA